MSAEQIREQFESWLLPSWSRAKRIDEDGYQQYIEDWVQGAWIGWRASVFLPDAGPSVWADADCSVDSALPAHDRGTDTVFDSTSSPFRSSAQKAVRQAHQRPHGAQAAMTPEHGLLALTGLYAFWLMWEWWGRNWKGEDE